MPSQTVDFVALEVNKLCASEEQGNAEVTLTSRCIPISRFFSIENELILFTNNKAMELTAVKHKGIWIHYCESGEPHQYINTTIARGLAPRHAIL